MSKLILLSITLIFFSGSAAFGLDKNWTNNSGDRLWYHAANWDGGIPSLADKAAIRNNAIIGPVIDSNTTAVANQMVVGDWSSTADSVEMTGGTLTTAGWLILGYGVNNHGTFNLSGGTVSIDSNMFIGFNGAGTLNMTKGSLTIAGTFGIAQNPGSTSRVFLGAGTITANSLNMTGGGTLDITNGALIINGDVTSEIETYIHNGWITGYGGDRMPTVDYGTRTSGKTTVWVAPVTPEIGDGDVNQDGYVDGRDLMLFANEWLQPDPAQEADLTLDGAVNLSDFQILAHNWHRNEYSKTLTGKVMCGYQGWFNCPGDGANRGWVHWGRDNKFEPGYCTVDWWPDMSEYDQDEKYTSGFQYADGTTAYVFSSYNEKTVLRHFSWMAQYGIDGIFLQRFATETTPGSTARAHRDQVMLHCRKGANQYKRAWAMMYDISGLTTGQTQKVIDDWKYLVDTFGISRNLLDQAYLHHNGKPVVAIWGIGFRDRGYTLDECEAMVNFFKNDPDYGGCTIMLGVPSYWRTLSGDSVNDPKLHEIIEQADIISPWAVGRFGSINSGELDNYINNVTVPDKSWCDLKGKDYLPVVFPGFSWQNLKGEKWDHIPRLGGNFLWRQFYKAINEGGATMIYQAMFDEVDEGTAIFKCTNTPPVAEMPYVSISTPFLPTGNAQYMPYDLNDASLSSDHYLWLVGEAAKMLTGERILTPTIPSP